MQFIKKHYEKILLGLALAGLVAALLLLFVLVGKEQQAQEDRRTQIFNRPPSRLEPPDFSRANALLDRALKPETLDFSADNKLFNPVRWQRQVNGQLVKNPTGEEMKRVEVLTNTPLYLTIELDRISTSPEGQLRFEVGAEDQAASNPSLRGMRRTYMSLGEKKEAGSIALIMRDAKGDTNNAVVTLELPDTGEKVTISRDKPFRRVNGYMTTLKYPPENRTFTNRRQDDMISFAGEYYKIVAIHQSDVVLSAQSNQKKWTIKTNSAP